MHPAASVIFFTTASGAGYGLMALTGLLSALNWLPPDRNLGITLMGLSLTLVTAGLLSSTFHLGHPERAWRAMSQWRSSWLSREGVAAVITYIPAVIFAIGWIVYENNSELVDLFGAMAAVGATVTIFCTAKIYESLKTIPAWHNDWVLPGYLVMGFATGAVFLMLVATIFGLGWKGFSYLAMIGLMASGLIKLIYWRSIDTAPAISDRASATGLGRFGQVEYLDGPTTSETYVMREMGYKIARKHAKKLRKISLLIGFVLPALFSALIICSVVPDRLDLPLALLATINMSFGIILERWLFFAEAKHVAMLYH